jgi:galactokinase
VNRFEERLVSGGLSARAAAGKVGLFQMAARFLSGTHKEAGRIRAYYVPGRIEVLGKHTDYAGGRSLVCTVERGFCVTAKPRLDDRVHIVDARSHESCTLALEPSKETAEPLWSRYPHTVVQRVVRNFPEARRGADIVFASDLPQAAGMSSSSALMIAVFLVLRDLNSLSESTAYRHNIRGLEELAGYLGTVENGESFGSLAGDRGVGTFGGSEDHAAILCSSSGRLKQFGFCPIRHERTVAFPDGYVFIIAVSGVAAMKTGTAMESYNRAALTAKKILELWCTATGRNDPTLETALTHSPDAPGRMRDILRISQNPAFPARLLCDRLEQFVAESTEIIPSATDALDALDLTEFGSLAARSQKEAETRLGNQVPETIELARSACSIGAIAASSFGAGFGGSVWAMVPDSEAADFTDHWAASYRARFPSAVRARFFTSQPGPAALRL